MLTLTISIGLLWGLAVLVPGPDTLMIVNIAMRAGRCRALSTVAGIVCGTLIFWLTGFFGVAALFYAAPWSYHALRIGGALYLIHLGRRMIQTDMNSLTRAAVDAPRTTTISTPRAFAIGVTVNLSNPKTALFIASLYASALPPSPPMMLVGAVTLTTVSLSATWYSLLALALTSRTGQGYLAGVKRHLTRVFGAIFVVFGVKLILQK
ncbi:LysE family translocator [Oricola thermophila]|uniref:LysE family translocator n=1 Tax=Oricola thermophila TaxID=2742145 RepID=A0A6N1VFB1_9HYPH|nr:LysE family translocator [Oricola thermophila]QKV18275.1 LysE family translocator [Oricola thermophila]